MLVQGKSGKTIEAGDMKYLMTVAALGLCASVSANLAAFTGGSAIELSNVSSVTNAVTVGDAGIIANSIAGRTSSLCSAVIDDKRCEISCRAPQLAQCGKAPDTAEPACMCK